MISAVILAGGFATRLGSIASNVAKALLKIADKPIIEYLMEKLERIPEISEIIISTNAKFKDQFEAWLSSKPYRNVSLNVEPARREEEKLGAIKAIAELLPRVKGEHVMILAGDNLFTSELREFVDYYFDKKSTVLAVYDVGDPMLTKEASCLELDKDGRIISFEEKPKNPRSSLVGTMIYLFPRNVLEKVHDYLKEGNPRDAFGHFTKWLITREKVYGYVLKGRWFDIGTYESYKKANEFYSSLILSR